MQAHIVYLNPRQLDQFLTYIRTTVLPESRKQPGYKGTLVLTDPKTGRAVGIGLWEDRQAMVDSGFMDDQNKKTNPMLKDPMVIENWEVGIADGNF